MDRESIITAATTAYDATEGTHREKLRGMLVSLVETLWAGHLMVATENGTQFLLKIAGPGEPEAGRPAHRDAIAFAASMEKAIAEVKGTAQDPEKLTTAQLVNALKATCASVPALIDAGKPGQTLSAVTRAAAIATVLQDRMA